MKGLTTLKQIFIILVIFGIVINILLWNITSLHFPEDEIELASIKRISTIPSDNISLLDSEWIKILREGKIKKIENFHNGLSLKWIVYFNTGHQAMIKLLEEISFFDSIFPPSHSTVDFFQRKEEEYTRADRLYQGWPEIAAFYLDRAIGFNKKPPITGRAISNKILFTFDNSFSTKIKHWVREFEIGVSVHGWVEGLTSKPPSQNGMKFLSRQSEINFNSLPYRIHLYLEYSDALLFDFLVDDHDKKHDFNWKATKEGKNLHWDSGLGFRHGPIGRENCLDIFCGPTKWKEENEKNLINNSTFCQRISVFRKETISLLRSLSPLNSNPEERLSTKWKNLLKTDPLYPVFHFGTYFEGPGSKAWRNKVHFHEDNFFHGLDMKMEILFDYIDQLIKEYGEENVLLSSGFPNTFNNTQNIQNIYENNVNNVINNIKNNNNNNDNNNNNNNNNEEDDDDNNYERDNENDHHDDED